MSIFIGGSASAMVKDIAEGYIIVTEHTFKKFQTPDLQSFVFELEKISREVRGSQADPGDLDAVQRRNRKLQRLNQVANLVSNFRARYRR